MTIQEMIKDIKEKTEDKGGIKEVYFIACGGSLASLYPSKYLIENESKELTVGYFTSNEFVHVIPKALGINTIAVLCSHRGNTPETIEAARVCQSYGAKTIALSYIKESPLTKHADYTLYYEFGENAVIENDKICTSLKIAFEILYQFEEYINYQKAIDGFDKINLVVDSAKKFVKTRAAIFADKYKDENNIYVMSSGASYGSAYSYAICILMEMQWINSSGIHSGEYFHGPFEITDRETPFILLMNEGRTRPLDERALVFLQKYGEKIIILDAKELGLNTIDDKVIEFFNPVLFNYALRVYGQELAEIRKHPLSQRRYMWKVEY
ncbi:MAG: phosphosugar isomerase [Clostridiales bacterium GWC2_40_7]|nr:MAG: phosphosugar isomerase [Clostridiales bacterium GWC2_40_7]